MAQPESASGPIQPRLPRLISSKDDDGQSPAAPGRGASGSTAAGVWAKKAMLCLTLLLPWAGSAQCAMCRAVLESNADGGMAEGINNGIVYLMAIPYLVVGALIFLVYRKLKT